MAKRRSSSSGKTSRKQRKVQRERSERAKQHGLPAKEPEPRAKAAARKTDREETTIPSMRKLKERAARASAGEIEGEVGGKRSESESTLRERIAKIPQAAQLAIVAAVVLLVIFVAAQFRGGSSAPALAPAPSAVASADELAAPVASVLNEAVAAPASPDPVPAPSAVVESATVEASDSAAPAATRDEAPRVPPPAVAATEPVVPTVPPKPVSTVAAPASPRPVAPAPAPAPVPTAPAAPAPQDNPY